MRRNKKQKIDRENEGEDIIHDEEMRGEEIDDNVRIPPLLILEAKALKDNPSELRKEIKENLSGIDIKQIRFTKNNNMLIYLNKHSDYLQLTNEDMDVKIGGKNFTTLKSKLYPFVVKGLNYATSNEFQEELASIGIVNSKEIKSIRFSNLTINKVILYCDNQTTANEHLSKGYIFINFIKYRTEEYKPPVRLTSCYKCQKFGHIAKQCKASNQVCPKCGKDDHATEINGKLLCTSEKKHCINCNQEHSSAYAGCQKKKQLIKEIKDKRNTRQPTQQQQSSLQSSQIPTSSTSLINKVTYASKLINDSSKHTDLSYQPIINAQKETIQQLNSTIKALQDQLSQANTLNQKLAESISNIEKKQVETTSNLTSSLIDFFLVLAKKTSYDEKTIHILNNVIQPTSTVKITPEYINRRLSAIANSVIEFKQNNQESNQPNQTIPQPSTSQQANQQSKSKTNNQHQILKQSTLNLTKSKESLPGSK